MSGRIRLIGPPLIADEHGDARRIRGHKSWALLARVLLSDRPVTRRRLARELFPDADDPLGSLRWCLAEVRRAVGSSEAFSGDPVEANLPEGTVVDVDQLARGVGDEDARTGELLQGVEPRCGPEFAAWLLVERERVASQIDAGLRQALLRALSAQQHERAIDLGRRLVGRQPYDERAHVLFVKALVASGMLEGAERHVRSTTELFLSELGVEPSPALASSLRPTVADPAPGVPAQTIATTLLDAGRSALDAGAIDAGIECLRHAVFRFEGTSDVRSTASALLELGSALVHAVRGFDDEGAVLLQQAADLATRASDPAVAAAALKELGYVEALRGARPTAMLHLSRAAELATGRPVEMAAIHAVMGFNLAEWGRHAEGLEHYRRSIELARSSSATRTETWALGMGARAHLLAGDLDASHRWSTECLQRVQNEQWVSFRPWPMAIRGEVEIADGVDPDQIRPTIEESFALSCQLGDPCWEGTSARMIALIESASGNGDRALSWIGDARVRCTRKTDVYAGMEASILASDASLSLMSGDAGRAETAARALLTLAARAHLDGFVGTALSALNEIPTAIPELGPGGDPVDSDRYGTSSTLPTVALPSSIL